MYGEIKMDKVSRLILIVIAICVISLGGVLIYAQQKSQTPPASAPTQQLSPRYTADQVIAVAKAYAGEGRGIAKWQQERYPEANFKCIYLGNGEWIVSKDSFPFGNQSWTFIEATGQLIVR